jgi:hypothetical protein
MPPAPSLNSRMPRSAPVACCIAAALAALAACVPFRGSPRHPPPLPPMIGIDSLRQLGFAVHGRNSGLLSTPDPIAVQVTITVISTTAHDTTVRALGGDCEVLLRFYRKSDRSDTPILDTSGPGVECFNPGIRRKLAAAAHDSTQLKSPRDGPAYKLPPGRYWLSGLVTWLTTEGSRRTEIPAGDIRVPDLP